jgi:hypothetical protein
MVETDGVGCSILLAKKSVAEMKFRKAAPPDIVHKEKYIDELDEEELKLLKYKKIVGIDPNKGDLIYCVDVDEKDYATTFRYTQNQRRKEMKTKKYRKIREAIKNENPVDGKTPTA